MLLLSGKFSQMTSTNPLVCSAGKFLLDSKVRKDPDGSEKGVASSSPTGQVAELLSWQPPLFQLPLVRSDRCVKPGGRLESRGLTLSCLFFWREVVILIGSDKKDGLREGQNVKASQ